MAPKPGGTPAAMRLITAGLPRGSVVPHWASPARRGSVRSAASTSSGSNLGPNSQELSDLFVERAEAILKLEGPYTPGLTVADIPIDLLTASASGQDPHISVEAAEFQAPRIAEVRGLSLDQVRALIDDHTEGPVLGFLGKERVNVLELNLALDRESS